jgi:hypothetical protein
MLFCTAGRPECLRERVHCLSLFYWVNIHCLALTADAKTPKSLIGPARYLEPHKSMEEAVTTGSTHILISKSAANAEGQYSVIANGNRVA